MILMRVARHSSLLGIAIEGKRITASVAHRAGGRIRLGRTFQSPLSLDPLTDDPELVGREIRNHLDDARIRESRCVVCVPLKWALTFGTELPGLSEADVDGFLTVQAEREFPFAPEDLSLSVSRYRSLDGTEHATIVAIPANHLAVVQKVLNAANLRPVSITLGITSLLRDSGSPDGGAIALVVNEHGVDMEMLAGGGVVALRSLDETVEADPDGRAFDVDMIARQMRITLGQLPPDLRDSVRKVKVFGPARLVELVLEKLQGSVGRMGLSVEMGDAESDGLVANADADAIRQMSPTALGAAAGHLLGGSSELEFLPARLSRFKRVASRISSRGALWLAVAAAVLVFGFGTAFLWQYWRLSRLENEWRAIEPRATEVETLQQRVRQFRLWFDDSPQALLIARKLAEAFPEDGAVWAKQVGIKDLSEVSCSGSAQGDQDWFRMRDSLRKTKGVEDLRFSQVGGSSPLQFSLSFQWNAGESDGV